MEKYLSDKFTHYVKDKTIQDLALDSNYLNTPKVDDYLGEIFESLNKSYGKESDGTLSKTQARISNVMGPLGRLWLNLEEIRTGKSTEELDLFECLRLVEQSVTLLGQANLSLTYARRLGILGRLTGDAKKAKRVCLGKSFTKPCALQPRFANLLRKYLLTCQGLRGFVLPLSRAQSPPGRRFSETIPELPISPFPISR